VRTQGLTNRLRLQHDYIKAEWDAAENVYHVTLRDLVNDKEVVVDCNVLVCATGAFSEPNRIPLEGEESFQGTVVHAARWPRDLSVESLRGKNVVVVGNGCSGVQIIGTLGLDPQIKITALARGQQWFMPSSTGGIAAARNSAPNSERLRAIRARFPILQRLHRWIFLALADQRFYYQWTKEGAGARKKYERDLGAWMTARAPENLKDKIVPTFPFQAKRYIFEDGYFAAINQPQNRAVYGRIAGLTPTAVRTDDGEEIPADVVVLSTGYAADHIDMQVDGENDSTRNYEGKGDLVYYHGVSASGCVLLLEPVLTADRPPRHAKLLHDDGQQLPRQPLVRHRGPRDPSGLHHADRAGDARPPHPQARGEEGRIFTHYPGSIFQQWWDNAWPVYADYRGGEKLARRQKIRKILFVLVLLVGGAWGGARAWAAGVPQRVVQGAFARGDALSSWVIRLVEGLPQRLRVQ
jgi:cation diffusion facilitator CzcD-associated flavoprotein CzcO